MALDRQSIEKKDFPIGRRGYDPEAVDAHLRDVADEVDGLKRSARQRTETVATTASEQVRSVLAAAEAGAAEIVRSAEHEAREIRDDASAEATRTREEANHAAHDYVGRVAEATSSLLQRVDAMQGELNTLLDTLRTGAHRVHADLQLLEGNLGELSAVAGRPRFEPEPSDTAPVPRGGGARLGVEDPDQPRRNGNGVVDPDRLVPDPDAPAVNTTVDGPPAAAAPAPSAPTPTPAPPAAGSGEGDAGARLVALDMALSGTPREETDRYLAEHFTVANRDALLDEVYASIGG
ncbi:MAG TPA: DivIVA domain-containing protein [Conexibacter sp.]